MIYFIDMKEEEFKEKLTPEQYRVMREKGEEKPFTGKYWDSEDEGTYSCAACGNEIFSSEDKFDSGSGFPSFKKALDPKKIELIGNPATPNRMELRCKNCASHLGYVIDGKEKYYQLNSASLELEGAEEDEEEDEEQEEKKSDKSQKLKETTKHMAMLAATAVMSAVVGAAAGFTICQNAERQTTTNMQQETTATSPAPVAATKPAPAPTLPTSSGVGTPTGSVGAVPPRTTPPAGGAATIPLPAPAPVEPSSIPPTEPPTPPADGTTP